jgi:hypothetical protein
MPGYEFPVRRNGHQGPDDQVAGEHAVEPLDPREPERIISAKSITKNEWTSLSRACTASELAAGAVTCNLAR